MTWAGAKSGGCTFLSFFFFLLFFIKPQRCCCCVVKLENMLMLPCDLLGPRETIQPKEVTATALKGSFIKSWIPLSVFSLLHTTHAWKMNLPAKAKCQKYCNTDTNKDTKNRFIHQAGTIRRSLLFYVCQMRSIIYYTDEKERSEEDTRTQLKLHAHGSPTPREGQAIFTCYEC